jgi:hypothetical protein
MSTTSKGLELSFRKCAHVADDLTLLTSSHSVLVGVVHFKIIEENLRKDFYVSEALLGEHVPECAETIQTREDADTAVEMSDEDTTVDIETFRLFTKWLSAKNLAGFTPFGPLYKHPMGNLDWTSGMPLLKLYIFVTDYNILRLADDAGRRFASFFTIAGGPRRLGVDIDVLPTVSKIRFIYEFTAADSPLREIVVKSFCAAGNDLGFSLGGCSKEFLVDVIFRFAEERDSWKG